MNIKLPSLYSIHKKLDANFQNNNIHVIPRSYGKQGVAQEYLYANTGYAIFDLTYMNQFWFYDYNHKNILKTLNNITIDNIDSLSPGNIINTQLINKNKDIVSDIIVSRADDIKYKNRVHISFINTNSIDFSKILNNCITVNELQKIQIINDRILLLVCGKEDIRGKLQSVFNDTYFYNENAFYISKCYSEDIFIFSCKFVKQGFYISIPCNISRLVIQKILDKKIFKFCGSIALHILRTEMGYHDSLLSNTLLNYQSNSYNINKYFSIRYLYRKTLINKINKRIKVGFILNSGAICKADSTIISIKNNKKIGIIAAGSFNPTLQKSTAIGYIDKNFAKPGTEVYIIIRKNRMKSTVTSIPLCIK